MIKKLSKEQQSMVSGGSIYCIFPDGMILVCYIIPGSMVWKLYHDPIDAERDSKIIDGVGIESYHYERDPGAFLPIREYMELTGQAEYVMP